MEAQPATQRRTPISVAADSSSANQPISSPDKYREGPVAKSIEQETAALPSDVFLFAAGAAAATSLVLRVAGCRSSSTFIGQWVPSILICGVYNKLVKQHGHDRKS